MLTKPQIESEQMKDLKYDLKIEKGIIIYTASTMEEQRDIAEYINSIDGEDYEIVDFSQKETHPMKKSIHTDSPKVIITNMQEVGFAPYCKSDNKATVTLDDKIEWCNRKIHDELRRNEGTILQSINLLRDSFFRDRKVICGMHPNFLDKMEYRPYFDYIDDWLDYVIDKVKFNESPEFTQSLPLSTRSNNSNEIQAGDMVFVFKNRVVCCPDFYSFKKYTEAERIEKLSQLPEISFPLKMRNVLVIAGPGGKAFGNEEINLLTSNIEQDDSRRMLCVGNGVEKIENEEIASKLEEISQNGDDTTIIIEMHGTEKDEQFYFINDDSYISSRELFEMVDSRFKDKPVDIVITSCHSGACLKDKDLLPKGSVVGALSQGNKTTASSDVKNFTENLLGTTDEFTTYNLVKLYLCGLKNRIPPEIGISGEQGTLQLDELLRNSIGKKIDKSKVINLLKETISAEEIEELINKIETSRNEYDICAAEYGKAIAVCATNEFGKDINHENYKSMEKNSRTMSLSTAYGFLETMDRYSTPIRRQSALNWSRRIIENSKDMDKGKEME